MGFCYWLLVVLIVAVFCVSLTEYFCSRFWSIRKELDKQSCRDRVAAEIGKLISDLDVDIKTLKDGEDGKSKQYYNLVDIRDKLYIILRDCN